MNDIIGLFQQALAWIESLHAAAPVQVKIAGFVLLLVAIWKSSIASQFLWDKLGVYKSLVGPILGLLAGALAIQPFSWSGLLAGFMGGVFSVGLHQLLDGIKALPVVGPAYQSVINFIEGLLPQAPSSLSSKKPSA